MKLLPALNFRTRAISAVVVATFAILATGGCAFLQGAASASAFVDAENRQLQLSAAQTEQTTHVAYRSPYAYQEYARTDGPRRGEALLLRAQSVNTVIDLSVDDLVPLTQAWRFNQGGAFVRWVDARNQRTAGRSAEYRRFDHKDGDTQARACMAFIRVWDHTALDPLGRPRQGYVGYICRAPGTTLTMAQAARLLGTIHVQESDTNGFRIGRGAPSDPNAAASARGKTTVGTDQAWGLPNFPLNRLRQFPLGGSYSGGG